MIYQPIVMPLCLVVHGALAPKHNLLISSNTSLASMQTYAREEERTPNRRNAHLLLNLVVDRFQLVEDALLQLQYPVQVRLLTKSRGAKA
jgi:hypothetical protein